MGSAKVYKVKTTRTQRLVRAIKSALDVRAFGHAIKILNYYNYTHVAELRKVTKGPGFRISPTASFSNGQNIVLGAKVHVGANVSIWAGSGTARIIIGNDVLIAPNVMITAANYRFNDGSPINDQAMDEFDVTIGNDVWIGYGAVILPGARIGDGAVIGAGAVVHGEIAPRGIATSTPAKVQAYRRDISAAAATDSAQLRDSADTHVLDLVRQELKTADPAVINLPLAETGIDSFDLISLRVALETRLGLSIPDREWSEMGSLADIARMPSLVTANVTAAAVPPSVAVEAATLPVIAATKTVRETTTDGRLRRSFDLNMPQMALSGMSESWLFKELGDMHWAMITAFLKSPSSGIVDEAGDRLYATFTRIKLDVTPSLRAFSENDAFDIESSLERYGASMFFGQHHVSANAASCRATSMSTFAKHGERGSNTSLMKGTPIISEPDKLPSLAAFPDFGAEYRTRRAAAPAPVMFECEYELLPSHDINGVGLLYFAAYPSVFDLCLEKYEGKGFLIGHSTVSKDVLYFANSEPTETLIFRLHSREDDGDLLRYHASLTRSSDGKCMSEVVSVKRRVAR